MSKTELERKARELFSREVELDQKLFDATEDPAPEEIGEAAAELTADALLDRMRDTPSRETDVTLLRRAIDSVRAHRKMTLKQIAQSDFEAAKKPIDEKRKKLAAREKRQRAMLAELLAFEELDPLQAGKLSAAIDQETGLLHVSKTRMMAQVLDTQEREVSAIALRPVDAGEIRASDVDDAVRQLCDKPLAIGPTFERVRQWFSDNEKQAAEQSRYGRISYRLIWRNAEIVTRDKYNAASRIVVEPRRSIETGSSPADLPVKAVSEAGGLQGGRRIESIRV